MLHIDPQYAEVAGFVAVLVAGLLLVSLAGRVVRRIFHFAGFGLLDIVLGIAVAAAKYLLLLSVAFAALERINVEGSLIPASQIESSRGYRPVRELSRQVLPLVGWVEKQVEAYQHETE